MAEYVVNLDCSEPIAVGDVNSVTIVHDKLERIVRCKDCKYYEYLANIDFHDCVRQVPSVKPDGFCAWGKSKED